MTYDSDSHTIAYYQSKATLFKAVSAPLFGGLLVPPILLFHHSSKVVFKILSFITGVCLLLWEILFLPSLLSSLNRLLFPRPTFVVNDEGITYQPTSVWFVALGMTMRWEEMAAIHLSELTFQRKERIVTHHFLAVIPKDQERFFQQHKLLRPRRLPLLAILSWTGSPLMLPEQMILPFTLNELLSQIRTHYQEQIQVNGIEIREEQKISFE